VVKGDRTAVVFARYFLHLLVFELYLAYTKCISSLTGAADDGNYNPSEGVRLQSTFPPLV
jgi:hypothetical protein